MKNVLRLISFISAIWLACYGHDTQQMMLWGIGLIYAALFMAVQLWPIKKPHRGNGETKDLEQSERNINFEETQIV